MGNFVKTRHSLCESEMVVANYTLAVAEVTELSNKTIALRCVEIGRKALWADI